LLAQSFLFKQKKKPYTKMYTVRNKPCLDKYPEGKELAEQQLRSHSLKDANLKAAFKVASIWKQPIINIHFMDGTQKQKDWVKKVINEQLAPHIGKIKLVWDAPRATSDIRISFAIPNQAWSYVGTDALHIPKSEPTMNLGWLDDDVQFDAEPYKNTGQVVLHEFGHAMGMIHEHQNPKNNAINWNKPVVYEELQRSNGWSPEQVNENMFRKYGDKQMCAKVRALPAYDGQAEDIKGYCEGDEVNGSEYDPTSVMHYWYPPRWILSGNANIPVNTTLSELDKTWLRNFYGTQSSPTTTTTTTTTPTTTTTTTATEGGLGSTDVVFIVLLLLVLVGYIPFMRRK
jgi:hypothetical protein